VKVRTGCLIAVLTAVGFAAMERDVRACTCSGGKWPSLKQTMHSSALAATAEVMAQGHLKRERLYPDLDVAYLDLRIVKELRGTEERQTIRLWDLMFGTSCSLDLQQFVAGTYIAFAADRTGLDSKELFEALEISPASDDYFLRGCGTYYKKLQSLQAAQDLAYGQRP
jgi:hypothetical protein